MRDTFDFWRNLVRDPRRVSALAPSGPALAALITREITSDHAPVIELGPGTGVFTRRLLKQGVPEDQLVLVESGATFVDDLRRRFPAATVWHMDARRLNGVSLPGGKPAGAVVSGLPLLSLPRSAIARILLGAFRNLRPDGAFYQFTYGALCPVPSVILRRLGLRANLVGRASINLPPAAVYRIGHAEAVPQMLVAEARKAGLKRPGNGTTPGRMS